MSKQKILAKICLKNNSDRKFEFMKLAKTFSKQKISGLRMSVQSKRESEKPNKFEQKTLLVLNFLKLVTAFKKLKCFCLASRYYSLCDVWPRFKADMLI